jgi:pSer/pThr/pTyr-binding forkhead associated (FHA) protein
MTRFQLLVRELGKAPRLVPLTDSIVVGRSRRADLSIDDQEVGREQFRIGVTGGFVLLESLGRTNATKVDDVPLPAGEKTTVAVGSSIRVGNTTFTIESAESTADGPHPAAAGDEIDRTIVARPGATPEPMNTMEMPRPGSPQPAAEAFGGTMEVKGYRPGQPGGAGQPPAPKPDAPKPEVPPAKQPPAGEDFGGTMQVKGYRPGQAGAAATPPPAAKPPTTPPAKEPPPADDFGGTMQVKGYRPGQAPPPTTTQASRPIPPTPIPPTPNQPAPAPAPAPPPAAPSPAAPSPAAQQTGINKPKTVALDAKDLPGVAGGIADLEARLHASMPRLVVKGEGLKRCLRIIKAKNKVGRAATADLLIPHESVSENHAEITFDGAGWELLDLGSTNGSVVDGKLLRSTREAIRRGSLLGLGNLQMVFLCTSPGQTAADRRTEEQALRGLTRTGAIGGAEAQQIREAMRADSSRSIAEFVLMETTVTAGQWASAFAAARSRRSMFASLRRLLGTLLRPTAGTKPPRNPKN